MEVIKRLISDNNNSSNVNKYNDVLNKLQDYMLTEDYIEECMKHNIFIKSVNDKSVNDKSVNYKSVNDIKSINDKSVNDKSVNDKSDCEKSVNIKNKQHNKKTIFIPKEKDTLFWCYYIIVNGDTSYEMLPYKNELIEKQMKIELINKIRQSKQLIKTYKTDTITNIENNLANEKLLNVKSFLTLCLIENKNILFINNKTYYECLMNDTDEIFIIHTIKNKYDIKYGFESNNINVADDLKKSLYRIDKIDKPIKAISAYKTDELIQICEKLGIEISINGKNKLKKDLYESIIQYF